MNSPWGFRGIQWGKSQKCGDDQELHMQWNQHMLSAKEIYIFLITIRGEHDSLLCASLQESLNILCTYSTAWFLLQNFYCREILLHLKFIKRQILYKQTYKNHIVAMQCGVGKFGSQYSA